MFTIHKIKTELQKITVKNKTKFFCIGANKTGTTSIGKAFQELGFILGDQRKAELLTTECFKENYKPLLNYCKTAQAFQDVPFSLLNTYQILDENFPGSKFILTIRDSSEQWYQSLTRFHSIRFGKEKLPSWEDLKNTDYVYKGWIYEIRKNAHGLTENDDSYHKEKLICNYEKRNKEIINYFDNRPNDLLIINLSVENSYQKFCEFLGVKSNKTKFPWENKTPEIK